MTETVSASNPVRIQSESKERVAYDLMIKIAPYELEVKPHDRDYWLRLYGECLSMASGTELSYVKSNRSRN